jgi:hypothetical protein
VQRSRGLSSTGGLGPAEEPDRLLHTPNGLIPARHRLLDGVAQLVHKHVGFTGGAASSASVNTCQKAMRRGEAGAMVHLMWVCSAFITMDCD